MKKLFTILSFLTATITVAQVQNNSFENWGTVGNVANPTNWTTYNDAMVAMGNSDLTVFGPDILSVEQSANAYSGTSSIRLHNAAALGGNAFVGTGQWVDAGGNVMYVPGKSIADAGNFYPMALRFRYILNYTGPIDTATFSIALTYWNYDTNQRDTIAKVRGGLSPSSTWKTETAAIHYSSYEAIDSIDINFSLCNGIGPNEIGELYLDDVELLNYPNDINVYTPAPVSGTMFTASANAYTVLSNEIRALSADQISQQILFSHRRSPYDVPAGSNSGWVMDSWSANHGQTWDSMYVYSGSTNEAGRYPGSTVFLPNNVNYSNPYEATAVTIGTTLSSGSVWNGNFFASHSLDKQNYDSSIVLYSDANDPNYQVFASASIQKSNDNAIHSTGKKGNGGSAVDMFPIFINKGLYNTSTKSIDWQSDTLTNFVDPNLPHSNTALTAFSPNGVTGFVVFFGTKPSATGTHITTEPFVYKSTDAGNSWSLFNDGFDFSSIPSINSFLTPLNANPSVKKMKINLNEGVDATVDADGNLHLFCAIETNETSTLDSLSYNTLQNSRAVDLYTTNGTWNAVVIAELPSKTEAITAFGSNIWTATSGAESNARLQMSRSYWGDRIFYLFTQSDYLTYGNINSHPNIYGRGFNSSTKLFTQIKNFTSGSNVNEICYFSTYAKDALEVIGSTHIIPTVITYNDLLDPTQPVNHYYVNDISFLNNEYTESLLPNDPTCFYEHIVDSITVIKMDPFGGGTGYISGNNSFGDVAKGEKFLLSDLQGKKITGANIVLYKNILSGQGTTNNSGLANVVVELWKGNNSPAVLLDQVSVPLANVLSVAPSRQPFNKMGMSKDTTSFYGLHVDFSNQYIVDENFYIVVQLPSVLGDTIALATSTFGQGRLGAGMEKWNDNVWHFYDESYGTSISNAIDAVYDCNFQAPLPVASFTTPYTNYCPMNVIEFTNNSIDATTYTWDFGDGNYSNDINPTHYYTFDGSYTVALIATNQYGSDTSSQIVTVSPIYPLNLSKLENSSICPGSSVTINANQYPGTYYWPDGNNGQGVSYASHTLYPSTSGYITVAYNEGLSTSCPTFDSIYVDVYQPVGLVAISDFTVCENTEVNIGVNASLAGVTFAWTNPSAQTGNGVYVTPVEGEIFTVIATSLDGCSETANITANVIANPAIDLLEPFVDICEGSCFTTSVDGFEGYNYSWSNGVLDKNQTLCPTASETLTVFATDVVYGCQSSRDLVITFKPSPAAAIFINGDTTVCSGNSITLTGISATPGADVRFAEDIENPFPEVSTITLTPTAGTHVYYTAAVLNGCMQNQMPLDSIIVTVNTNLVLNASTNGPVCEGSTETLTASGADTYTWTDITNSINLGNTAQITINPTTGFTVEVQGSNAFGCSGSYILYITPKPLPAIYAGNDETVCKGSNTILSGANGISYTWSPATGLNNVYSATPSAKPTVTTEYTLTGVGNNGCYNTDVVIVNVTNLNINITSVGTACNGATGTATANVSAGTEPYTYYWNIGAETESIDSLPQGIYTLTVSDDMGCTKNAITSISSLNGPSLTAAISNVSCNGGDNAAIDLTITGGTSPFTYQWSNGATTEDISGLAKGPYEVIVTGSDGCGSLKSFIVTEPSALMSSVTSVATSTCGSSDGSLTIMANGGTPSYSYVWDDFSTADYRTGLSAGT